MRCKIAVVLGTIVVVTLGVSAAHADSKKVCFGEFEGLQDCILKNGNPLTCKHTCHLHGYDQFIYARGLPGGFSLDNMCRAVCGRALGDHCGAAPYAPTEGGNCCGYAWTQVTCN